jgi:tripartite-type tricarboxylate transporter receptor subunit TctC
MEETMRIQHARATRRQVLAGLAAAAALPASASAQGSPWPQKPVRVMVGFAAGGNIDNLARLTCNRLGEAFGQPFVVENRVGAMGSLAAETVARAAPDGYTLFWAGTGTVSIFPALGKTPYDPIKDFEPVSMIATSSQVLIVNPNVPAKTVAEFVAYVKGQQGKLSYAGGGGPGSVSNLLMQLFMRRAGIQMTPVTYRGTAPALTDLIGGHIPTMFVPLPEALAQREGGKIRILGISSGKRARQAPDVPTIAESGFPGFDAVSWTGLLAPAGMPKEIVDKIAGEFVRATKDPEFVKQLDTYGAEPQGLTPAEFAKFLEKDREMWAEVVRAAGIKLK